MNQGDLIDKVFQQLKALKEESDKAIDQVQKTFFESLKRGLSDDLSEQQINEILEDFNPPFDRLRLTMRKHWDQKFSEGLNRKFIHGE